MERVQLEQAAGASSRRVASCDGHHLGRIIPFHAGQSHECLNVTPGVCPQMDLSVSTLTDAYVLIGAGRDGVVFDNEGRLIKETAHFTHTAWDDFTLQNLKDNAESIDRPLVLTIDATWRNYYHWTLIGLGKAMLYNRLCPTGNALVLIDYRDRDPGSWPIGFSHDVWRQSLALSGAAANAMYLKDGIYKVRSLDLLHTSVDQPPFITYFQDLYRGFRDMSRGFGGRDKKNNIIIARPHDGRLNEDASRALLRLAKFGGYSFAVLETMSFADQIKLFASANVIVSPHGAGLSNIVYASRDTKIVEINQRIQSEAGLRPWFYILSGGMDQSYAYIDNDIYDGTTTPIYDRLVELAHI